MTPKAIRALRTERGWTQRQLATACGVHKRTVIRREQGDTVPGGAGAMLLATHLAAMEAGAPRRMDEHSKRARSLSLVSSR